MNDKWQRIILKQGFYLEKPTFCGFQEDNSCKTAQSIYIKSHRV